MSDIAFIKWVIDIVFAFNIKFYLSAPTSTWLNVLYQYYLHTRGIDRKMTSILNILELHSQHQFKSIRQESMKRTEQREAFRLKKLDEDIDNDVRITGNKLPFWITWIHKTTNYKYSTMSSFFNRRYSALMVVIMHLLSNNSQFSIHQLKLS